MNRRQHDRLTRPGRRRSDRRPPAAENRRVLLVGTDEAWRLLATYVFEEAGYVVYAAANERQAVAFTGRLLPDVVLMQVEALNPLEVVAQLAITSSTRDIPVVVLATSLHSADARRARAAGAVVLLPHTGDIEVLIGEVDTLIAVDARARRTLKRRLLDLQDLARYYTPDAEGRASLRRLIDHLQVAIFAVDEEGQCIAASEGVTNLTGYSRLQLLTTSLFQTAFGCKDDFLGDRHDAGTTTITTRQGEDLTVHAAAVAEILPGFHVAAFAAA
ncbi:MAG: PAS domain-containing protein [Acidobacteriota bacterium]